MKANFNIATYIFLTNLTLRVYSVR